MYCADNPVMFVDVSGKLLQTILVLSFFLIFLFTLAGDSRQPISPYLYDPIDGKDRILLSDGNFVYYSIDRNTNNPDKTRLKIYNSYQYKREQIKEFLAILKKQENNSNINIDKITNEWWWHKLAYSLGYNKESSASVDAYFNSDDEGHGIFSWIINNSN